MQTSAKPEILMHTSVYSAHSQNKNDPPLLHSGCHHRTATIVKDLLKSCARVVTDFPRITDFCHNKDWNKVVMIKRHEVHFCISSALRPRSLTCQQDEMEKRDTWSASAVSSMKPSAQRHAQAPGVEMATAHVTVVATFFHYCRKVTLCLNGKSPNYNFAARRKCSAATQRNRKINSSLSEWWTILCNRRKSMFDICTYSSKNHSISVSSEHKSYNQIIHISCKENGLWRSAVWLQEAYPNPVLSRCTFPWLYKGGSDQYKNQMSGATGFSYDQWKRIRA